MLRSWGDDDGRLLAASWWVSKACRELLIKRLDGLAAVGVEAVPRSDREHADWQEARCWLQWVHVKIQLLGQIYFNKKWYQV